MIKRCIGIEIGHSYIRAVQLSRTNGNFCVEKTFDAKTRRLKDSQLEILKSLTKKYGFDPRATVAVSMPNSAVFFRTLETDSPPTQDTYTHSPSALEHSFPLQADEIVAQTCSFTPLPNDKYSLLLTAADKDSISQRLDTLTKAKLNPDLADTIIFAVYAAARVNHPEIAEGKSAIICADSTHLSLALTQENNILIARNIPIPKTTDDTSQQKKAQLLCQEIKVTWQKAFGAEPDPDDCIYLTADTLGDPELVSTLQENLGCKITKIDPCRKIQPSPHCDNTESICVPLGLALRALAPEQTTSVNFIQDYNKNANAILNFRKELTVCVALAASIIVIALAGLFIRASRMQAQYSHLQDQIETVFSQTLPTETTIVNPLVQLDQKLQSLQNDYKNFGSALPDFGPLEILYSITESIPTRSNISIDNILINSDSVRLAGNAKSFEHLYNWQEILQTVPEFTDVNVHNPSRDAQSGSVQFTILLSLAIQGQK
jgi:Tfp pilus assembly PilM family ATPase